MIQARWCPQFTGLRPKEDTMLGFKRPSTLRRLCGRLAGPSLQGFADALAAEGYPAKTSAGYLSAAAHLTEWAARRGTPIAPLDEAWLARFVRHLPGCRCRTGKPHGRERVPFRIHRFLRYLRTPGVVTTSPPAATPSPRLAEYGAWMRDRRGLAATTITRSRPVVQALLGPWATIRQGSMRRASAGLCSSTSGSTRRRRLAR